MQRQQQHQLQKLHLTPTQSQSTCKPSHTPTMQSTIFAPLGLGLPRKRHTLFIALLTLLVLASLEAPLARASFREEWDHYQEELRENAKGEWAGEGEGEGGVGSWGDSYGDADTYSDSDSDSDSDSGAYGGVQ